MVSVDSIGVPRDPTYSGYFKLSLLLTYGTHTLCGQPSHAVLIRIKNTLMKSYNPKRKIPSVWALSRSLAATEEIDFSFFSCKYLDVSVPCVRPAWLCIHHTVIQESPDQSSFISYPRLIADCHALLRLLMPRHPPSALSNLITWF